MSKNFTAGDLKISEQPHVEQLGPISQLQDLAQNSLFRVHFPRGVNGVLMTRASGELEGLNTTSIISGNTIVGTAGLEPIDVPTIAAKALLAAYEYCRMADKVNALAESIASFEDHLFFTAKIKFDNVIFMLKDVARRVPSYLESPTYQSAGLSSISQIKIIVGEFFQEEAELFDKAVSKYISELRNSSDQEVASNFEYIKKRSEYLRVEKALELLAFVDLLEIVVDNRYTERMFGAASDHLRDRYTLIENAINSLYGASWNRIEKINGYERQNEWTLDRHEKRQREIQNNFSKLNETRNIILNGPGVIHKILKSGLSRSDITNLWVQLKGDVLHLTPDGTKLIGPLDDIV